jgi:uncharacterized protein (TIGR02145 family)
MYELNMTNKEIYEKYGNPVDFTDFRYKGGYTRVRNEALEKAICEDNYGAFRIQLMKQDMMWHRICDPHQVSYLYDKHAGKILRMLLKIGKEDRTKFDAWTLLWNTLRNPNEAFGEIIRGFAEYPCLNNDEKADMLAAAVQTTYFLDKTYGLSNHGWRRSTIEIDKIHDLFEELFPGKNPLPERFGTWTDTRDGQVYGTVRIRRLEWLRMPLKFGMDEDGLISEEAFQQKAAEIIPDGWRVPCDDDLYGVFVQTVSDPDADTMFGGMSASKACSLAKDAPWPLIANDMAYPCTDDEQGSDKWNREIGISGLDLRPTYGTGDSRESTVTTFITFRGHGRYERRAFSLQRCSRYPGCESYYEPECRKYPNRYDAKVYERACVLLCREADIPCDP